MTLDEALTAFDEGELTWAELQEALEQAEN